MDSLQVEVKIELGHKASCKETLTPEGFTHDWVVFVRGPESCDISHFVDKVVFNLHESFAKPRRVLKDPPYQVAEAGYGSFFLPIEVYFKNKEEPRKLRFDYDLFLPVYGSPPIDNIRSEALTFRNPTDEFRRKLVKGGGIVSGLPVANGLNSSSPTRSLLASQHSIDMKDGKGTNNTVDTHLTSQTLTLEKDKPKKNKHDKPICNKTARTQDPVTPGIKRSSSLSGIDDLQLSHSVKKKKKKTEESTVKSSKPVGFIPLELPIPGSDQKGKLEDVKDIKLKIKSLNKKSGSGMGGSAKKKSKEISDAGIANNVSGVSKHKDSSSSKKSKLKSPKEDMKAAKKEDRKLEKITFRRSSGDSWSSSTSTSSLSGNLNGSKNTALNKLLAEIGDDEEGEEEEEDDDVDIFKPFSSSAIHTSASQKPPGVAASSPKRPSKNKDTSKGKASANSQGKKTETVKDGSKNGIKSPLTKSPPMKQSPKIKPKDNKDGSSNGQQNSSTHLVQLYKRLVALKDSTVLQKIVDILEGSGRFEITETTLDFDLCALDKSTIKKIENSINR